MLIDRGVMTQAMRMGRLGRYLVLGKNSLPQAIQIRMSVHITDIFRRVPASQLPLVGQMPSRCLSWHGAYIFIISVKKDRSSSPGYGLVTSDR